MKIINYAHTLEFGLESVRFKGGGGSSGKIEYPPHITAVHSSVLNKGGTDEIDKSLVEVMNDALSNSPWAGEVAYDPTTPLADMWAAVCSYNTVVKSLNHDDDWMNALDIARTNYDEDFYDADLVSTSYASFISAIGASIGTLSVALDDITNDVDVAEDVNAYARILDDEVDNNALVKFRAGMRDINAVNSSSFMIGEALIQGMKGRDIAKYMAAIKLDDHKQKHVVIADLVGKGVNLVQLNLADKQHRNSTIVSISDQMIKSLLSYVEFEKAVASLSIDAKNRHIIANKEYVTEGLAIAESDATWDLELFNYMGNLIAAPGGGTSVANQKTSKTMSALGGAASGAAIGSQILPGWGTAIGAVVGAGAALLSS